jgi:hypothetical protein
MPLPKSAPADSEAEPRWRRTRSAAICVAAAALALGTPLLGASSTILANRAQPVPEAFLGLTIHRPFKLQEWPALEFSSLRLWDNYLRWTDIQPQRDVWRWEALDAYVELGTGRGKQLIYTLGQTPRWASSRPDDKQVYGEGAAAMPASMEDWRTYIEAVAIRYRGRIAAYEIWNEPKEPDATGRCGGIVFFCGSADDLVKLAAVAYRAIKQHDPAAIVTTPAFDGGMRGADKLDRYLAAGGRRYTDAVSFHFYQLAPEDIWAVVARLKEVMARHGLANLPLWNTESGFLVQDSAGRVQRQHDSGTFYAWDNGRMGALDAVSGQPTALARSMAIARGWLVGSTVTCGRDGGVAEFSCTVRRGGQQARLLWNSDRAGSSRLEADRLGGAVRIGLLDGSQRELAPGEFLPWDGAPVRVELAEQLSW